MKSRNEKLLDLEERVRTLLELWHQGKEYALSKEDLCKAFPNFGERTLRRIIKHLVIKHNYPIGSCPQGYFWAVTPEEIEEVVEYYRHYGLSCLQVAARLRGIPLKMLLGQLTFDAIKGKLENGEQ